MREMKRMTNQGFAKRFILVRNALLLGALLVFTASGVGAREQVTIQKTATNAQLRAADGWADAASTGTNHGADATLQVRKGAGQARRALVLFDLSIVPNAGIKNATLTLHIVTPPGSTRTYEAHIVSSFFNEPDVTWATRVNTRPWGAAGGDFDATATSTTSVTNASTSASFNVTQDLKSWYNSTANYGTLIKDSNEGGGVVTTIFSSKEDATPVNRPSLTLTFLQNVTNLTATPGNAAITLNWSYPTPIGTVLEAYTGVLILRRANFPVDKGSIPTDGVVPALCSTVGTGTVVFTNNANATTFTDNAADTCGGPTNGQTWYYKVFARDSAGNWTANGPGLAAPREGGSTYTAEACGVPNPPGSTQTCLWMLGTHTTTLAAPGLIPAGQVVIGGGTNQLFNVDATTGARLYPAVALSGAVFGRSPVLEAIDSSIAKRVTYVADQDHLLYAVDISTGQILWLTNPTGLTTNAFLMGPAVIVKKFAGAAYTLANDLVIVGTHNAASTTTNRIVALDGNTGAVIWTVTGNSGVTPAMDIISSTPAVDYIHNAVWVTSRSAGGALQPSLWKINPNTGAVLFTANLGDMDGSVSITPFADVLFVGNNAGTLYAINPVTGATLQTFAGGDGAIRGFPDPVSVFSPFTVVFSGTTKVQAVTYNSFANTFTALWNTTVTSPSAPIVFGKVYVGSSDGKIHELDLATGADAKQRAVSPGYPAVIGDPAIDTTLLRVYVSTTTNDQRAYACSIPF